MRSESVGLYRLDLDSADAEDIRGIVDILDTRPWSYVRCECISDVGYVEVMISKSTSGGEILLQEGEDITLPNERAAAIEKTTTLFAQAGVQILQPLLN